jgi:hypothetical protein
VEGMKPGLAAAVLALLAPLLTSVQAVAASCG